MRMMLKINIPTEAGNRGVKDGSLPKILEATISKLRPEAAYFLADSGLRSAMIFFDLREASDIPGIVEPLFLGLRGGGRAGAGDECRGPEIGAGCRHEGDVTARKRAAQQPE